jgi:DNA replication and repair protein RecF
VQIGSIQLLEFRNYQALSFTPAPRLNLLIGLNAQGKTNLLEALAVLLAGRSFRTARLAEIPAWGVDCASVTGEAVRQGSGRKIRRTIARLENGSWRSSGDSVPWARVIAFGWHDLSVLNGAPAARRSFIDGFAARLTPGHLSCLVRYRQILGRRNHLLQTLAPTAEATSRLGPWDEQLASEGMRLIAGRRQAVAALQTEVARVYPALAGVAAKVEIRYQSTVQEETAAEALLEALARGRREEWRRRQTLVGPHRDDMAIDLDGVDVRTYGSRGQQRLLALALRLAEVLPITAATGTCPVLLLDDALSELDHDVRRNALREMRAVEQVFLTSPEPLAVEGATRWIVQGGGVAAA